MKLRFTVHFLPLLLLLTIAPATAQQAPTSAENRRAAYLKYIEIQRMKASPDTKVVDLMNALREAIQLDPQAADPHADLGEIYFFNLRQPDRAEKEALEAIRLDPDCFEGRKLLARIYTVTVRFDQSGSPKPSLIDKAIQAYEEVARIDAGSAEAWAFIAELYQMRNNTARQVAALEKLAAISAPSPMDAYFYRQVMNTELSQDQTLYLLSRLYLGQGKHQQAMEAARKAFELDPESAVNARNLMEVLRYSSNVEEELAIYNRLIRQTGSPLLQIGYAASLIRSGMYGEAIAKLREYLKSQPTNAAGIELLAAALRRSGRREEAAETLKQAIPTVDIASRQKLNLELGETYLEMGRTADAIAFYEGALNDLANKPKLTQPESETFADVVSRLTRAYGQQGERQKVRALLSRARSVLGDNSAVVDSLSIDALRDEGKYTEALEAVRAAEARNPDAKSFRVTEGLVLADLRNYGESLELLRKIARETVPVDTGLLTIVSTVEMKSGELKAAEATIRKAIEADSRDTDLQIQLSSILERSGQKAEAEKTLRSVLVSEPDNAAALNNLGFLIAEKNSGYQEALGLIQKAVSIEPLNGSYLDSLGWVQYRMGRLQEARGNLEKALVLNKRNPLIFEHLGDVLKDLGRIQEARKNWESALEFSVETGVIARLKNKIQNTH